MELGICVASKIDDVDYVVRAEELGYAAAWMADSQMLWSDPYAVLALAATRTSRIRLGTGVSVAATRPAPVTAASIATINVLAPGRTFLGVGAGNTAMRIMGHKPMPIAELDAYLSVLRPLLRGEEAELTWRGRTARVRHVMPDAGFVDFDHEIPLHVSGFGPRSIQLAGRHGDGAVLGMPGDPAAMAWIWSTLEAGAASAGRTLDRSTFTTSALTTICVLDPGEPADSPRARHECGAMAMAALHYQYDQWRQYGREPAGPAAEVWDDYTAMLAEVPGDVLHQRIHAGHNCWVVEEEERFLTPSVLRASCVMGTADEVVERLRAFDEAGLHHVMILPSLAARYEVLERVARDVLPHV